MLLDTLDQSLVELDLDLLLLIDILDILFSLRTALGKESLPVDLLSLLGELSEVRVSDRVQAEARERHSGGGGYAVGLVDSSERHSVELVRPGD